MTDKNKGGTSAAGEFVSIEMKTYESETQHGSAADHHNQLQASLQQSNIK
jgi:hypothetical protein